MASSVGAELAGLHRPGKARFLVEKNHFRSRQYSFRAVFDRAGDRAARALGLTDCLGLDRGPEIPPAPYCYVFTQARTKSPQSSQWEGEVYGRPVELAVLPDGSLLLNELRHFRNAHLEQSGVNPEWPCHRLPLRPWRRNESIPVRHLDLRQTLSVDDVVLLDDAVAIEQKGG